MMHINNNSSQIDTLMNKENSGKPPLRIILGGDTATKNLTVYEYEDTIIVVDYGIGFPEGDDFGVDFLIPDMSYLLENSHKVKGIFVSHAHADHFAALPYLLRELNVDVYCNRLVQGLLSKQLEEKSFSKLKDTVKFHTFDETTPEVLMGPFKVSAFHVNHSVPGSLGIAIKTPQGVVLHIADFKIDWSPVLEPPIDVGTIANYGKEGVLCLLSDCLGAMKEGYIESEATLNNVFNELLEDYEGRQLLITTISSNVSRMHQIIKAAQKAGRKVVLAGRSINQVVDVSKNLGYVPDHDDLYVDLKKARGYDQSTLLYVVAGCFGQSGSALDRISLGEHNDIDLIENAVVAFSAEPNPPGVDVDVLRVTANLTKKGVEVVDHNSRHLHVSVHGHLGDLRAVAAIARPKYFIPIGGDPMHMKAYTKMVTNLGFPEENVFVLGEGESVEFADDVAKRGKTVPVQDVFVDGTEIDPIVLRDREQLSNDGVFVVVVPVNKKQRTVAGSAEIVTRGFIYVKESAALMGKARDEINKVLNKVIGKGNKITEWNNIKGKIERDVERLLFKETGRKPIIIVHSIFI